jgi:hypothetical protein
MKFWRSSRLTLYIDLFFGFDKEAIQMIEETPHW